MAQEDLRENIDHNHRRRLDIYRMDAY
ncbi:hypothetical protein PLUA15_240154 [Pseudomonas lundensis]|uniref:Uncharacterized protein n=1 Tax=Pseudomonas lundensis TaxID=86185 RepID=A0AAX2H7E0_9PSED|nr:hypothetical protein PLUA15_240154 [Pseudomonas lundensis]